MTCCVGVLLNDGMVLGSDSRKHGGAITLRHPQELKVQIHLGYELMYRCPQPTPMILNLTIHPSRAADLVDADQMLTEPWVPLVSYADGFGNRCTRLVAPAGRLRITADALINDRGLPEPVVPNAQQHSVESLPEETLVYLLGSRYCDTEHLSAIAWSLFGNTVPGWSRVQSICNFVSLHIKFGYQFARPTKTASEAFHDRQGVCRDYAHLAIALCRCLNIPARYCTGYLGDIGIPPVNAPMDLRVGLKRISGEPGTRSMPAITPRASAAYLSREVAMPPTSQSA